MVNLADLIKAIKESKPKTSAYDTTATVLRIDGETAWVHIPGGTDETPVNMTINASVGDTVQVRVSGGSAFLVGNATAPPTDDTTAIHASKAVELVSKVVSKVQEVANMAAKIAGNTNQYFWHTETGTDTGAHITEITQEEFLADPENGGGNLLARSNGIALREGLTELTTVSQDGFEVYSYDSNDDPVEIAHLGYGDGTNISGGTSTAPYYSLGTRASGSTIGNYSVAGGYNNAASGFDSVALGTANTASGAHSFAAGFGCTASNSATVALGNATDATAAYAFAEGYGSQATGQYSHAQNQSTIAASSSQTAIGKYNVEDSAGTYAFIIGNGTASTPSNAVTVDWNGVLNVASDVTINGTSVSAAITGIETLLANI